MSRRTAAKSSASSPSIDKPRSPPNCTSSPWNRAITVGRTLLVAAESELLLDKVTLLQVKTLGPSNPDEGYRKTRDFYAALGFLPLEETTAFWGPEQPTLVMVKVVYA